MRMKIAGSFSSVLCVRAEDTILVSKKASFGRR